MKRLAFLLALGTAACVSVEFQPFRAQNNRWIGSGGATKIVDGVEIWTMGAPDVPFEILGYVRQTAYARHSVSGAITAAQAASGAEIAAEAKKHGGDAVVLLSESTEIVAVTASPTATGDVRLRPDTLNRQAAIVIRYLKK